MGGKSPSIWYMHQYGCSLIGRNLWISALPCQECLPRYVPNPLLLKWHTACYQNLSNISLFPLLYLFILRAHNLSLRRIFVRNNRKVLPKPILWGNLLFLFPIVAYLYPLRNDFSVIYGAGCSLPSVSWHWSALSLVSDTSGWTIKFLEKFEPWHTGAVHKFPLMFLMASFAFRRPSNISKLFYFDSSVFSFFWARLARGAETTENLWVTFPIIPLQTKNFKLFCYLNREMDFK